MATPRPLPRKIARTGALRSRGCNCAVRPSRQRSSAVGCPPSFLKLTSSPHGKNPISRDSFIWNQKHTRVMKDMLKIVLITAPALTFEECLDYSREVRGQPRDLNCSAKGLSCCAQTDTMDPSSCFDPDKQKCCTKSCPGQCGIGKPALCPAGSTCCYGSHEFGALNCCTSSETCCHSYEDYPYCCGQGMMCPPQPGASGACAPQGSTLCYAHSPPWCPPGETCVQGRACAPQGSTLCPSHEPPYCPPHYSCALQKTCVPPGGSVCIGATFPNGTRSDYCPPGWLCGGNQSNATCTLGNICGNATHVNVCPACQSPYIHTQESCDKCVAEQCHWCNPKGDRGCLHSCPTCCHDYIDDCDGCVRDQC